MAKTYETKLWGGRFKAQEDSLMEQVHNGFKETLWMLPADIMGSVAHVEMLDYCGILTHEEADVLIKGLNGMLDDLHQGKLDISGDYEDVHTYTELVLLNRVGDVAKKLHTARSRNDQCNTDMKLYVREQLNAVIGLLKAMQATLKKVGEDNNCLMPGYTHLQRAQAVTFKHYMMAYHDMFSRDVKRLQSALQIMDECPLGCGALAGTTHDIDREFSAAALGFQKPYDNFLDGVSDRDFVIEAMNDFSLIMMHLSRLSEELVLWSSQEFHFIVMDDKYTTGSSIMPQKKNPDGAELVRGRCGRVYGLNFSLLSVMKSLPLAYNKDMGEDKPAFYAALVATKECLTLTERMVGTMKVNKHAMHEALKKGFLNATEVADYLVKHGVAFRDAHSIVGQLVLYAEDKGLALEDLTIEELKMFSPAFGSDAQDYIQYEKSMHQGIKKEML